MRVLVVSPYILCMHVLLPLRVLVVSPYILCMHVLLPICSLGFRIVFMVQHTIRRFVFQVLSRTYSIVNPKHLLFELGKITETEASFAVQKNYGSIKESRAILHIINYSKNCKPEGMLSLLATSFKACMHHLTFINMVQMTELEKKRKKKYYLEARSGDCCLISVEPTRMFFPYFFSIITLLGTHC
ncbi:hypothetical protein ACJX0J_027444 [Zea mays]